jgi:hypothetical protein
VPLSLVIALAAIGVLLIALVVPWLLGYEPLGPLAPIRASASEASERTLDWMAEFWHWLVTGR